MLEQPFLHIFLALKQSFNILFEEIWSCVRCPEKVVFEVLQGFREVIFVLFKVFQQLLNPVSVNLVLRVGRSIKILFPQLPII
jgi:hypothetical protein